MPPGWPILDRFQRPDALPFLLVFWNRVPIRLGPPLPSSSLSLPKLLSEGSSSSSVFQFDPAHGPCGLLVRVAILSQRSTVLRCHQTFVRHCHPATCHFLDTFGTHRALHRGCMSILSSPKHCGAWRSHCKLERNPTSIRTTPDEKNRSDHQTIQA